MTSPDSPHPKHLKTCLFSETTKEEREKIVLDAMKCGNDVGCEICSGCGVATLSIDYYDLGVATGKMAAKILKGEADISTMPIEYAPATKKYNKDMCDLLGLTVPAGYVAMDIE